MRRKILTREQTKFAIEMAEESATAMIKYLTWQTAAEDVLANQQQSELYQKAFDNGFLAALDIIEEKLQSQLRGEWIKDGQDIEL